MTTNAIVESLDMLSNYCRFVRSWVPSSSSNMVSEFLIHAADVEGLCQGIDEALVTSECVSVVSRVAAYLLDRRTR